MEELIYLAIVVGWFLLNAYKKSQEAKRKRQAESGPETFDEGQREPAVDMEQMLRELMGVPKEPQPEPEPVFVPQPVRKTPRSTARQVAAAQRTPRAVRPTAENAARAASDARNERRAVRAQEAETVAETVQGFDLRQAVIHSAILQRPYS
jgi:hypothetical protein